MDIQHVDNSHSAATSSGTANDEAEGIWSADIEQSFLEALAIYPPCGRRKIILTEEGKMYGRNELVARYIKIRTGKTRTRKQVSSHLQVLAKRRSKEIQSLRDDKAAQKVILERLKQYTSAEIVSMDQEQITATNTDSIVEGNNEQHQTNNSSSQFENLPQPIPLSSSNIFDRFTGKEEVGTPVASFNISTSSPMMKKTTSRKTSSTAHQNSSLTMIMNNPIVSTIPTSPIIYPHSLVRSRCSSNTSSSSPLSSGSNGSQSIATIPHPQILSAVIGDDTFRLHELSAFVESQRTMIGATHSSFIYPSHETQHFYQHDLLRLQASDVQMKAIQRFETISVDQISDKFPRHDGLKDLFENNPSCPFFLIKFWADVAISSVMINADDSFFTNYAYICSNNRPIHISTRLCSFGRQVLEKVDTSDHPHRDSFDEYIHRFDRAALCDYMVQFIQKLRSLPKANMMNSVLENFTVLQVIKCLDNPEQLLLCLAFVFEIATLDTGGPQYQVYKLVAN